MTTFQRCGKPLWVLVMAVSLGACGGAANNEGGVSDDATQVTPNTLTQLPGAPALTGDIATDGYNWMNYRRNQIGLSTLTRNGQIDNAALGHSDYQKINDTITHVQVSGKIGFTGVNAKDRLAAAGYTLVAPYAYGEVISATTGGSGFAATEQLIAAIYHRFVIFEPLFVTAGSGASTTRNNYTYFTTDFAVSGGYGAGVSAGKTVIYPGAGQTAVPTNFFSDAEEPDPVPDRNEVGYPISVHSNITSNMAVQTFTVRAHGATSDLAVRLLTIGNDSNTPRSAAAIVPLTVLSANTTYDVKFIGSVDGMAVKQSWSFTTK